jgi:hypothetical protein
VRDAGAPAAKQVGQLAADIVKVVQLACAPVQYLGALQDRYRAFWTTRYVGYRSTARITPPAQILGPILERIRYEPADTPIDHMFSELLSRSMDSKRANEAHPA